MLAGQAEDGGGAEPAQRLHDQVPARAARRRRQGGRRLGLGGTEYQVVVVRHGCVVPFVLGGRTVLGAVPGVQPWREAAI
ncbi:hypothetical protein Slala02_44670 [Streptomyces lavendulae subsp. lavendulae]|nr:hypothetical protein Slala01_20720 [Streptomyces lavendulae subsp. lavendulae]GLX28647.1 hypothetical protein Slala02_44670 [Streptomyces lavendulae subsp. lavendulae]